MNDFKLFTTLFYDEAEWALNPIRASVIYKVGPLLINVAFIFEAHWVLPMCSYGQSASVTLLK
jgi:hypothetical protein